MKPMNANELLAGLALARPVPITAVVTDSRKVQPGCIFVCFPGERVDGHDYAAGAYRSGAEYIVANHPVEGVPADRTVIVPEVVIDGETVSSTRIRRLLAQGDMHEVNNLLGRGYSIAGRVEEGKQVGRTIGFPTANITIPPHKALPAFGVYACYLETSGGIFPAVVNVGRHPTLPEGHVTVEAHVLDEFLSLYGRNVRLTFLKFMRPEQKFDSIETLRAQIAHDADDCRAYFAQLQ